MFGAMRVPAALAVLGAVATRVEGQGMVLTGLPTSATAGYTFPEVGSIEMGVEFQTSSGARDLSFCAAVDLNNPGACGFTILARMTYNDVTLSTVSVTGGGYFLQGRGRFTQPAPPTVPVTFDGFLNTLLPSPALLKTGTLEIRLQSTGRPTVIRRVTVLPGSASFLYFQVSDTAPPAGTAVQAVVRMLDDNDNVVTNGNFAAATATVTGTVTSFNPIPITFTQGAGSFSFTSRRVETIAVSVSHTAVSNGNGTQRITVVPAPTSLLAWNASQPTFVSETATAFPSLPLIAYDQFGNVNTGESRSIAIAQNGVQFGSARTFVSGRINLTLSAGRSAGDYNFTLLPGSAFLQVNTSALVTLRVTVVCNGVTEFQNLTNQIACHPVRGECPVGTFQVAGPTPTSDRNCSACNGVTEYQDATNQTSCLAMSPNCTAGAFEQVAASPSTDRVCAACPDGTFSNSTNAALCSNVTACVAGQEMVSNYTNTTDRVCRSCPAGYVDADADPYVTRCTPCMPRMQVAARFPSRNINVTFTEQFNSTVTVRVTGAQQAFDIASWSVRAGGCDFPNGSAVLSCAQDGATPCGDLDTRLGGIATVSLTSAGVPDPVLRVVGTNSVFARAVTLQDSTGSVLACATLAPWDGAQPSLTTSPGQTQCSNVTTCGAGQEELAPFTYTSDRTCRPCRANATWSDGPSRFCTPVQTCAVGFQEGAPPTVTSDRVCAGVTCPSLDPPAFGNITTCRGSGFTEPYLTSCTYSCDTSRAFQPISVTRTCQGNGSFDGVAPTCRCEGTLHLDSVNGVCVTTCPDGFIASARNGTVSACRQCAPTCTAGFYEAVACDPVTNTDRVCTRCTTCPAGSYATGGCFTDNSTDTQCSPFSECDAGSYEVVPGTPTSNRQCGQCRACTNTSNSATLNTLYAAGGCCGATDTICDGITLCPSGFFESSAPGLAPQGGYGTDRRCQRIRQCGAGEYVHAEPVRVSDVAVSDRECRACSQCGPRQITVSNCTATQDTVCAAHQTCPAGQYLYGASAFGAGACRPCTACASFEYEAAPCGANGTDTVCRRHRECDGVTEYETAAPTATTDRQCGNCTVCGAGERLVESCDTTRPGRCATTGSEVCPRGTAVIRNVFVSYCAPCAACPAGTFARGGASCPHTDANLGYTDPRCFNVSTCPDGFAEVAAPTPTTDRICQRCARCPAGSYNMTVLPCVADPAALLSGGRCAVDPPCPAGQYEIVAGGPDWPRRCAACRACASDEFAVVPCGGSNNTVCRKHQQCPSNQALLRPGTATSDAVCYDCPTSVRGSTRLGNDPYLCPDVPFAAACPAPPPTQNVPSTVYTELSFSFAGDYNTIVGLPTHTARHELFNRELRAHINASLTQFSPSPIFALSSASGSIVVTMEVVPTTTQNGTNTSHTAAVAAVLAVILDPDFNFVFEGTTLAVDPTSIQTTVLNPNSPAPTSAPTPSLAPTPAVLTTTGAPTAVGPVAETARSGDDDDFSTGALAGIVIAAVLLVALIVAIVVHRKRSKDPWDEGVNNTVYNPASEREGSEYLGFDAEADADDADGAEHGEGHIFSSQVTEENRRLKQEIDGMESKISEKNAILAAQKGSRKHAEHVLEVAVASRLAEENKAIQREIAAMKKELRKKREASKFQRAAALQAQLKAERATLEDEIATSDEVAQVALHSVAEYGSLEEAIADHDADEMAEHERIAKEKARLSAEMAKMTERLASM